MAMCTKCGSKLRKRKSDMHYHCKRHGPMRKINTPKTTYIKDITSGKN